MCEGKIAGSDHTAFARQALRAYDLPASARARLISLSENATFLVEDDQPIGVLRVYRIGYQSQDAIRSELAWIDALLDDGDVVRTPAVRRTRDGEALQWITVGGVTRACAMFEYIRGTAPAEDDLATYTLVGRTAAALHLQVQRWQRPDWFTRAAWDIDTILVQEKASAVSTGTVKTARNSSLKSSISAAGGITRATGPWANLAGVGTQTSLDGQGTTSRDTTLNATISAVVTQVLPNGGLVIQGTKNVKINSENQVLSLRGIVRPVDLSTANLVPSDRVAQMELQVNGKGVVADSVRRPFVLYRLIMGILPF